MVVPKNGNEKPNGAERTVAWVGKGIVYDTGGLSINVGALIGHSAVRLAVMGEESQEREATQDEIDEMAALIDAAILHDR